MSQKYTLELYSDAAIVQKGTPTEQQELRSQLQSQIDSWTTVYGENGIESLWNKLSKINLADAKTRADITAFITAERQLKGGNAGPEFENRFKIIEKYFALAEAVRADTDKKKGEVVDKTREDELELRRMQHGSDSKVTSSAKDPKRPEAASEREPKSVAYSREFLRKQKRELDAIKEKLKTSQAQLFGLLESAIKNPTLQAVVTLQTEIKDIDARASVSRKGVPDGWFGPLTLQSLQNIAQPKPSPGAPPASAPSPAKPASAPAASASSSAAGAPTSSSEKTKDTYTEDLKSLQNLLGAWRSATKGADKLSDGKTRESNGQLIDAAMKALIAGMTDFNAKYVLGKYNSDAQQNAEYLKSISNEMALYLRGEGGVSNKHYRDSFTAEVLLKGVLGTKLTSPSFPTQTDIMKSLDGNTKTLIVTLLDAKIKQGKTFEEALGDTLSNPTIKGAWDRVYEASFAKYEKGMIDAIGKLDQKSLTAQEINSLNQLRDMYGTTGWLDFKDRNKVKMVLGRDQLLAVGLGIAGAVFTATAVGSVAGVPMMLAASALAGGALATGATMVLEGKIYSGKETLQEGAINVGTFLAGGILFRVVRSAGVIGKIGTGGALGAEMAGDYTLGVTVDQIRSQFQGVDISLAESLKNNLPWALLPLVFRGGSMAYTKSREAIAKRVESRLQEAQVRQALGDTKGAAETLAQVDKEIGTARAVETPATARVLETPPARAENPPATAAVEASPATTNITVTFEKFFKNLESKLKKLKDGESVNIGDATVTLKSGDYVFKPGVGESVKFPVNQNGLKALKGHIAENVTPDQMLKNSLARDFNGTVETKLNKEIQIGDQTYRISKNEAGGFMLEKKGANGGFTGMTEAQFKALSEGEADALMNAILGKGTSGKFDSLFTNPFSPGNPMFDKVKNVKVKDMFGVEFLKKIPTKLWDWSIGNMWKELGHSWHLNTLPFTGNGLGKIEVLRTLFTGRSSHGHLWSNEHHGLGKILPTAWTPSLKTLGAVGLITGAEFAVNGSDKIHGTQDFINYAYNNKGEFANNYFNYIWLGWLGSAIVEGTEVVDLGQKAAAGVAGVAATAIEKFGTDGQPSPSYLVPAKDAVGQRLNDALRAADEALRSATK